MEKRRLNPTDEVIYCTQDKTLMEKTAVESIDRQSASALLSNKVRVTRIIGADGTYSRIDGKKGFALPLTEENLRELEAFKAYFSIKRILDQLKKEVENLKNSEKLIELNERIKKCIF